MGPSVCYEVKLPIVNGLVDVKQAGWAWFNNGAVNVGCQENAEC